MSIPPPESRRLAEKVLPRVEDSMMLPQVAQDFLLRSLFNGGPDGPEMPPEITEEDLVNPEILLEKLRSIAFGD